MTDEWPIGHITCKLLERSIAYRVGHRSYILLLYLREFHYWSGILKHLMKISFSEIKQNVLASEVVAAIYCLVGYTTHVGQILLVSNLEQSNPASTSTCFATLDLSYSNSARVFSLLAEWMVLLCRHSVLQQINLLQSPKVGLHATGTWHYTADISNIDWSVHFQ